MNNLITVHHAACGHEDYPCCGCGPLTSEVEDGELPEGNIGDDMSEFDGDQHEGADEPDDGMDGDHASALASAGFGTDEDYGGYDIDAAFEDRFECDMGD